MEFGEVLFMNEQHNTWPRESNLSKKKMGNENTGFRSGHGKCGQSSLVTERPKLDRSRLGGLAGVVRRFWVAPNSKWGDHNVERTVVN